MRVWPWEGQASGEGWEVAALNRPEQGKARYQGWPCWHRAEKGWGIDWSFIRGEKEQPASSHLRRVGEPVQATQPSHLSRLVLGSLKTQLGQEEMGNSATVESNSSSRPGGAAREEVSLRSEVLPRKKLHGLTKAPAVCWEVVMG